jgi:hypothetical protein
VCLSGCCICFTHTLQIFYLYVAYVFQWFFKCFQVFLHVFQPYVSSVSNAYFKCSSVFIHMLQMFHLGISETDRVLLLGTHLPQQASERGSRGSASGLRVKSGDAGDIWTARAPTWAREMESRRWSLDARVCLDVRALALP